jgi:1-aminocyclopropane-1-carboxylate deaminase/D-cysteine desulfhydrase-like pyridoxal-dependent ACC family enzyme
MQKDKLDINENTPLVEVNDPFLRERKISLFIKREDLNHPHMSGNKWYKLKYNIREAKEQGKDTLLTFGGAYSNHIYATAAAGKIFNFNTIGIIRGEEHNPLNSTLSFAKENGMKLYYLDRESYRKKNSPETLDKLIKIFGDFYLLPEGGTNELAVNGCSEMIRKVNIDYDYICCPCGTGGTLAGLITGLNGDRFALGFAVLKGASFLEENVNSLLQSSNRRFLKNWHINLNYHFGGYAKFNKELLNFIERFISQTEIPIEPIYTGKMLFGIYDLIANGFFQEETRIITIHTGGMQGLMGLQSKNEWKA